MEKMTYVGLDVHLNLIVAVWKSVQGKESVLTVENTKEGLEKLMKGVGKGKVWAAYEASGCGWGIHDRLTEMGWKASVLAPTLIAQSTKSRKTKTDVRDARRILEVLMSHGELGTALPKVWIPEEKTREDREVVRRRLTVAEHLTQVKNGITGLLRMHGIERPEEMKTPWTQKHVAWLRGLSGEGSRVAGAVKIALGSQVRELEFLQGEVERMEKEVEALAQEGAYEAPVTRMKEISGVGTVTAMTFLVELGDPKRFQNRRQVASYLGLVPTSFESGEAKDRKGHITRMGPSRIRKVLNQAALAYVREKEKMAGWYEGVAARRGKKKAIVGLMRRLGIELWQRARTA